MLNLIQLRLKHILASMSHRISHLGQLFCHQDFLDVLHGTSFHNGIDKM